MDWLRWSTIGSNDRAGSVLVDLGAQIGLDVAVHHWECGRGVNRIGCGLPVGASEGRNLIGGPPLGTLKVWELDWM